MHAWSRVVRLWGTWHFCDSFITCRKSEELRRTLQHAAFVFVFPFPCMFGSSAVFLSLVYSTYSGNPFIVQSQTVNVHYLAAIAIQPPRPNDRMVKLCSVAKHENASWRYTLHASLPSARKIFIDFIAFSHSTNGTTDKKDGLSTLISFTSSLVKFQTSST